MDLERYDHCGVDMYCEYLWGDHWGASGDDMDWGITVARRKQLEGCVRVDGRDNRDQPRINGGMQSHRGEIPDNRDMIIK